jgi:hypothetical protein
MLKTASTALIHIRDARAWLPGASSATGARVPPVTSSTRASAKAITTFTAGPPMAIQNSFIGSDGMRSSRASPPIG